MDCRLLRSVSQSDRPRGQARFVGIREGGGGIYALYGTGKVFFKAGRNYPVRILSILDARLVNLEIYAWEIRIY